MVIYGCYSGKREVGVEDIEFIIGARNVVFINEESKFSNLFNFKFTVEDGGALLLSFYIRRVSFADEFKENFISKLIENLRIRFLNREFNFIHEIQFQNIYLEPINIEYNEDVIWHKLVIIQKMPINFFYDE